MTNSDARIQLFRRTCEAEFGWLDRLGFVLAPQNRPEIVEYVSDRAAFRIGWITRIMEPAKRVDAELDDLELRRLLEANPSDPRSSTYRIGVVASYLDPSITAAGQAQKFGGHWFHADSEPQIRASVKRMSEEWRTRLTKELLADEAFWAELGYMAIDVAKKLARIRERAIQAFEDGDFGLCLKLYEQVPKEIRRADRKRIEIARRKLGIASS